MQRPQSEQSVSNRVVTVQMSPVHPRVNICSSTQTRKLSGSDFTKHDPHQQKLLNNKVSSPPKTPQGRLCESSSHDDAKAKHIQLNKLCRSSKIEKQTFKLGSCPPSATIKGWMGWTFTNTIYATDFKWNGGFITTGNKMQKYSFMDKKQRMQISLHILINEFHASRAGRQEWINKVQHVGRQPACHTDDWIQWRTDNPRCCSSNSC